MRKKIIDAIENINFYVMIVLGGLAFVYTIGDTINIFENIEWLQNRYEEFILLLLSNIIIHLISDHYGKIEEIQKSCKEVEENLVPGLEKKINYNTNEVRENLINIFQQELKLLYYKDENLLYSVVDNIEKVRLTLFQDDLEMKKYLIRLLKKCKFNVMDLTWAHQVGTIQQLPQYQEAEEEYEKCIQEIARDKEYKEIFIFNYSDRYEKLKRRLSEKSLGYSCAYYLPTHIPLLQFVIMDEEEVLFISNIYPVKCAVRSKEIAAIFVTYYKEVWNRAIKIKEGKDVYQEVVERIFKQKETGTSLKD